MDKKHILIIDDEADIRESTQMCLEIIGEWEVSVASSGYEGLIKAAEEKPDIILLDVMMPGMDGLATLQKLRENSQTAQIPIILLTAKARSSEQRQFNQLDIVAVITKPYDPYSLSDRISEFL
ncbi:response regulator [Halomicronema hongdechloris C2206]|uniref:Response regulator n=1 Tax=Halomicronema hongdechloris C2206 TaxID=1641165 RepID=A0A1Z3HIP9_9CYAN|nr:response regulator [Halomicronema hongdechloris]ASC70170.1 response regulator [Halomicronema hongdechloris C2206]